MKKKISLIIVLALIIVSLVTMFSGCSNRKADKIEFNLVDEAELNKTSLENKKDNALEFVKDGTSNFVLVCSEDNLSRSMINAIEEAQTILREMTDIEIPFSKEKISGKNSINIFIDENLEGIEADGFVIDINEDINLMGRDMLSMRNSLYYFLEEYLGVIYVSNDDNYVPKHNNIFLEKGKKIINPAIKWRSTLSADLKNGPWAGKLLLNSVDLDSTDEEIKEKVKDQSSSNIKDIDLGLKMYLFGRQRPDWYGWCHTMYKYVSPEEYFDTHPEYFSKHGGKRIHESHGLNAHLCLTNPEVYNIVEAKMAKIIEEHPEIDYLDFSVNDNYWVHGCECKECKKADRAAGGTGMGTLLPFLNKLARRFPDKYISTLAYFHTIKPPKNIKAEKNVVIKLCSMPGDQGTSYLNPGNSNSREFNKFVRDWKQVCDNIIVWDYLVNYKNLSVPFPNFAVQQENQKFYEDNNLHGLFHQGSKDDGTAFSMMRTYITCNLMFKGSSYDVAKECSKYIQAYYGDAAEDVIKYFNKLSANLSKSSSTLGLYDNNMVHFDDYLSKKNVLEYEDIIEDALKKVEGNDKITKRVEELKRNIYYAKMLLPNISGKERKETKNTFDQLCEKHNITMMEETVSLETFNEKYKGKVIINQLIYASPFIVVMVVVLVALLVIYLIKRKKKNKIETNEN